MNEAMDSRWGLLRLNGLKITHYEGAITICRPLQSVLHSMLSVNVHGVSKHSQFNLGVHPSPYGRVRVSARKTSDFGCMRTNSSSNGSMLSSSPVDFELELGRLLSLIPQRMRIMLTRHPELQHLIEIVLDLGRKPLARFPSGDFLISEDPVTFQDLEHAISLVGDFADDNRAGIDRSLHRISAIRNRRGRVIGLTCRVGRAVSGSADIIRDLVELGGSLLLIGPPGVGKTTVIREVARMLADDYKKRVVIVDTSNEIAGDGDIPHAGIGGARRMQVPNVDMQHKVMIEAVENHMPQAIVIDEIGTELEALAASTIAQRGIQLVGTAHGMTIENLIKNPSLEILVGGIQSVTLGDDEALRRGVQKTVLERKGPPTFTCGVEMMSRSEWRVHHSLEATVDAVLAGRSPLFEVRKMNNLGVTVEVPSVRMESGLQYLSNRTSKKNIEDVGHDCETDDSSDDDNDYISRFRSKVQQFGRDDNLPFRLYTYQIVESNLEQVMEVMGLEDAVKLTDDIGAADAILALHSKLKQNAWVREMAKYRQLPVFVIKTNTMSQMARALRAILGVETFRNVSLSSPDQFKNDKKITDEIPDSKGSLEEIDALEEARLAIEHIVIPKGQPVELLPRHSAIIDRQIKLAEGYQLATEKTGAELNMRLRILPLHATNKRSNASDLSVVEGKDNLFPDFDVTSIISGTSVAKLPFLPN